MVAKYNPLLDAIVLPPPLPGLAADAAAVATPEHSVAPVGSATQDPSLAEPAGEVDEGTAEAATSGAAKAPDAPGKPGNSVYLSDKELLKMQSATDEGEVSE